MSDTDLPQSPASSRSRILAHCTQSTVLRSRSVSIVISSGRPQPPQFTRIGSSVSMAIRRSKTTADEIRAFFDVGGGATSQYLQRHDHDDVEEIAIRSARARASPSLGTDKSSKSWNPNRVIRRLTEGDTLADFKCGNPSRHVRVKPVVRRPMGYCL